MTTTEKAEWLTILTDLNTGRVALSALHGGGDSLGG